MADEKKKGMPGWAIALIVVAVLGALAIPAIGVLASLGIYGTRRYVATAKEAEGKANVTILARGLAAAAAHEVADPTGKTGPAGLPPSSNAVPSVVPSGKKYMSTASDWADPAFKAAHFQLTTPQYFQYAWERKTPTQGTARARADFDGDGKVDVTIELDVTCASAGACTVGTLRELR